MHLLLERINDNILVLIVAHDLTWNGLDMCSKLWSKCLPFRASLWAFLSVFYWRFCLIGLTLYSYPGLEAHVCDGLSGWKKYVTCVKTLLLIVLSNTYYPWYTRFLLSSYSIISSPLNSYINNNLSSFLYRYFFKHTPFSY